MLMRNRSPLIPKAIIRAARRLHAGSRRLAQNISGISMVEFALVLPVLLTLGLFGAEIALLTTTKMKVSQIALSLGDNASRLGQTDNSGVQPTVTEADVTALLQSALQQGTSVGMAANSRIILTSLEYDDFHNKQFIAWQRCLGQKTDYESDYGNDTNDNGITGDEINGMGNGRRQINAARGEAVMFVEIFYEYDAIFDQPYGTDDRKFKQEAAFLIRDDRNLGPGVTGPASQRSRCD